MPNQEIEQRPSIEGSALRQNITGQQSIAQAAYSRDAAGTPAHRPGDAMMLAQHGGLNFQNDQHLLPRDGTLDFLGNNVGGRGLGDQSGTHPHGDQNATRQHGDQNAANVRDQHAHGAQAGGDKQGAQNLSDTSAAATAANDQSGSGRARSDSSTGGSSQSGSDTQNARHNFAPSDGRTPAAVNPESTLTPGSRSHAMANGDTRSESAPGMKPGDQAAAGLGKMLDQAQQQYLQNLIDSWMAKHPGQQLPPELASLFNSLAQNGGGAGGAGGGGSDRPASAGSQERQQAPAAGDPPSGHSGDRHSGAGRQHYQSSDGGSQQHSQGSQGSDNAGGRTHSRHHAQAQESQGSSRHSDSHGGGSRHSDSGSGSPSGGSDAASGRGQQSGGDAPSARQHGSESSGRAHYSRNSDAPDAGAAAKGSDKPTEPTRDARGTGGTGRQSDSNAGTNPHTDRPTGSNAPSDKPTGNGQQADKPTGNAGGDGSTRQNAERASQTHNDASHVQPQQSHNGRFEWNQNAHKIYDFLTNDMHFTKAQASGIMGNFAQENATFDPSKGGDHGAALGIGQWNGVRKHALENFAAQHGGSAKDLDMQLQYFKHEAQTTEKRAINAVRHATTSDRAALAFSNLFERPGHAMNSNRIGNAREVYARFAPDQPDSALAYDERPGRV